MVHWQLGPNFFIQKIFLCKLKPSLYETHDFVQRGFLCLIKFKPKQYKLVKIFSQTTNKSINNIFFNIWGLECITID